jgi:hypothetical protein
VIAALSYVLSLLVLKLTGTRRVSHACDVAADPGAALFAALTALPKATALTTYSYRLEHRRQAAFLTSLQTSCTNFTLPCRVPPSLARCARAEHVSGGR